MPRRQHQVIKPILGLYSAAFAITFVIASFRNGFGWSQLFLLPLPLYFVFFFVSQIKQLYRHLNHEFTTESYRTIPTTLNFSFLFVQTSPTFLITICLLSAAISGTFIKALLK